MPPRRLSALPSDVSRIVGVSSALYDLLGHVDRAARSEAGCLILGESGVGKELIARRLHAHSARAERPFVTVNCGGFADTLLESELFGHRRGSFTGAHRDTRGKFEVAHWGTLFLDEVGEMTPRMQGLLLRVLETGEIHKVGDDCITGSVDVRVVAATHRSLPDMVAAGTFREDLFYRLSIVELYVPPLRERPGDVRALASYFVTQFNEQSGTCRVLSEAVYAALEQYRWPGNVRQLQNIILRTLLTIDHDHVTTDDLPDQIRLQEADSQLSMSAWPVSSPEPDAQPRPSRLYMQMRTSGLTFWDCVQRPYLGRQLTRADVQEVIRLSLLEAKGRYRVAMQLMNVDQDEYKKFMGFLRDHRCLLPFREFRD